MSESPLGSTISSRHFIYGYLSYTTLRVEFARAQKCVVWVQRQQIFWRKACLGCPNLNKVSQSIPLRKSDKRRRENESTEIPRERIVVRYVFATA